MTEQTPDRSAYQWSQENPQPDELPWEEEIKRAAEHGLELISPGMTTSPVDSFVWDEKTVVSAPKFDPLQLAGEMGYPVYRGVRGATPPGLWEIVADEGEVFGSVVIEPGEKRMPMEVFARESPLCTGLSFEELLRTNHYSRLKEFTPPAPPRFRVELQGDRWCICLGDTGQTIGTFWDGYDTEAKEIGNILEDS